jgi:hypothetical protein
MGTRFAFPVFRIENGKDILLLNRLVSYHISDIETVQFELR